MKDLIACLNDAGLSREDMQVVILIMAGRPAEIDELSLFIIENHPSSPEILEKAVTLANIHPSPKQN